MPTSTPSSTGSSRLTSRTATAVELALLRQARQSPDAFLELCFADPAGGPLRQAAVHVELQAFLSAHRKALVELPRDHGKSVQVCGRIVWELGRNPGLRVKLVCATDPLAADRSRFLRDAIGGNDRVRAVFPGLRPGRPWAAAAFARGYRLVPVDEGEVAIRPEWVAVWVDELSRAAFDRVALSVDPEVTARATADASALVVLGRVADGTEVRCLEAAAHRVATPDLVALIDAADRRWRPDVILFEANAAFAGVRDLLVRHARFGPRVQGVVQSRSKAARVAGFSVPVQNGTVRLKGDGSGKVDVSQRGLFDEMTTFPFGPHDDLLDAAATGTDHLLGRPDPRVWL